MLGPFSEFLIVNAFQHAFLLLFKIFSDVLTRFVSAWEMASKLWVAGCGRFLGDRMKGLSYVQSQGRTACGGSILHHADDNGLGGEAPEISDRAVSGTLAGGRS